MLGQYSSLTNNTHEKFFGSDWLKAVLTKCKKAKQSAKIHNKIQIAKKLGNISLL